MAKSRKAPLEVKYVLPLIEDPATASPEREGCRRCKLHETCLSPFMPAFVPRGWTGKLLIVGEAPGVNEDADGRPFTGKAGQLLYRLLGEVGIQERDVALSNSTRCRPEDNATPSNKQIWLCRPFLVHEILSLRPKWVLAVGTSALKALFGNAKQILTRCRQRAFDGVEILVPDAKGIKIAFTWHPASAFYQNGPERAKQIREDLSWLVRFTGYREAPKEASPSEGKLIAVDIEWDNNYNLLTVGRAWNDQAEVTEDPKKWDGWLGELFQPNSGITIVNHSVFGDLPVLAMNGVKPTSGFISGKMVRDTLLMARLVNENLGAYDLESLSVPLCGTEPWKLKSSTILAQKGIKDFSDIPSDIRMERCRLDSWAAGLIYRQLIPKLNPTLVSFTHQLAAALKRVELAGVKISEPVYNQLKAILQKNCDERASKLQEIAKRYDFLDYSPSNNAHFRSLLFDSIGAISQKLTAKTREAAVNKENLVLVYQEGSETEREAILAQLRYQKAKKLFSTYIGTKQDEEEVGLAKHLTPGFFVFQRINPLGARTGRRASSKPNLMNWPKRMRAMLISRFPKGRIIKGDESQLEPRIMAEIAGIDAWQQWFKEGKSLYLEAAKLFWKRDIEKGTPLYDVTKSTILGTNYGMEAELFQEKMSIEQGIHLTLDEAQYILNLYHSTFPELPRFFALQKEILLQKQQVTVLTGQVRHLPCPQGERTPGFKHLWNQAVNFPIQCLAAYVTGSALIDLEAGILAEVGISLEDHYRLLVKHWAKEKIYLTNGLDCDILYERMGKDEIYYPLVVNEVHDELVVDSPEEDEKWVKPLMESVMAEVPTLRTLWPATTRLSLSASISGGSSWAGQ